VTERGRRRFSGAEAPVSLRDAIVAAAELRPSDPGVLEEILAMLAMTRPSAAAAPSSSLPKVEPVQPAQPQPQPQEPGRPQALPPSVRPQQSLPVSSTLTRIAPSSQARPAWLVGNALAPAREAGAPLPPPPIFASLQWRGIYTAALSTWVEEGEVDLDRAVEQLASAQPLHVIPRVPLRTLRRGVQLLLDRGPNMAPFATDVAGLEEQLGRILSGSQLERQFFMHCPSRGVRDSLRVRLSAWRSPPRGVPVLVASDFGIGGSPFDEDTSSIEEWRRFALEVQSEGHTLVGLIPFPLDRWPAALAEVVTFVFWSEHTIAGTVDRALREAQRRCR